ncbi:MAG: hypothetical protein R2734_02445 [Nocardioides sp.]
MATGKDTDGFSAAERAAMKERAAELRAEGKKGAKRADGLQAVLDAIAKMAPEDRAPRRAGPCDGHRSLARPQDGTACRRTPTRPARWWSSSRLGQVRLPVLHPRLPGGRPPRRGRAGWPSPAALTA